MEANKEVFLLVQVKKWSGQNRTGRTACYGHDQLTCFDMFRSNQFIIKYILSSVFRGGGGGESQGAPPLYETLQL